MRRTVAKSVMQSLATIATMALTTACSVGSFTGKVGGIGFTPKDAIYAYAQYTSSNPDAPAKLGIAIVTLTSTAGACDDLANHVDHQRSESVYFTLFSTQGTADALPKGDYPLSFSADTDPNTIQNVAYAYFQPHGPQLRHPPLLLGRRPQHLQRRRHRQRRHPQSHRPRQKLPGRRL